jgi:hypothetical protein
MQASLLRAAVVLTGLAAGATAFAATVVEPSAKLAHAHAVGIVVHKSVPPTPVPRAEIWALLGVGLTMSGALLRRHWVKK